MIIDQIYVISVKSSVDRRIEFSKKNPDIVNLSNFKWFLVEKDTQNTVRGCYNSHRNVLIDAKKNNFKNILILEDDSYLVINFSDFKNIIDNMYLPENWNIIQLSYIPIRLTNTNIPNLLAVNCTYWTNAYLANVDLLTIPEYNDIPIDCVLFGHNLEFKRAVFNPKINDVVSNTYAYYPMLFYQDLDNSVIGNIHFSTKKFINFFGDSMTNIATMINTHILYLFSIILIILTIIAVLILSYYIFMIILFIIIVTLSIMIINKNKILVLN